MTIEEIGKAITAYSPPLEITVHRPDEASAFASALFDIVRLLGKAAGDGIVIHEGGGAGVPAAPSVTFRQPECGPIHYLALPRERELPPFQEMLLWRREESGADSAGLRHTLAAAAGPASLTVFMGAACPHCPGAVRAANMLALCSPAVTVSVIDVQQFPELAERFNVRTVPMTIIDDELLIDKVVTPATLASAIASRASSGYLEDVLLSHIDTGNAGRAAQLLLARPRAAEAFCAIWKRSSLSLRMGLMLAAAQAIAEERAVFDTIVPELIALLDSKDEALRGDSADLLGQIGHSDARRAIETLLGDGNPDIREIAQDALDAIQDREEQ